MYIKLAKWSEREGWCWQWQEKDVTDKYGRPIEISPIFYAESDAIWWRNNIVPQFGLAHWSLGEA